MYIYIYTHQCMNIYYMYYCSQPYVIGNFRSLQWVGTLVPYVWPISCWDGHGNLEELPWGIPGGYLWIPGWFVRYIYIYVYIYVLIYITPFFRTSGKDSLMMGATPSFKPLIFWCMNSHFLEYAINRNLSCWMLLELLKPTEDTYGTQCSITMAENHIIQLLFKWPCTKSRRDSRHRLNQ